MNRFEYSDTTLSPNEIYLIKETNVRLYDGDVKTTFEGGEIIVTSHRIFWGSPGAFSMGQLCLALPLSLITLIKELPPKPLSFSRSRYIVLHLSPPSPNRNEGAQLDSKYDFIKLSFQQGFNTNVTAVFSQCVSEQRWLRDVSVQQEQEQASASGGPKLPTIKLRSGIVGIERGLEERNKQTDESISAAFQDLKGLIGMAKDMVSLSRSISTKIRDRQGDISTDETIRFKAYLLSLGVEDPVTRDDYSSSNAYYESLAVQVSEVLSSHVTEAGGLMTLTDAYCRVNRARGMELLSPEDLLHACTVMGRLGLPVALHRFESGVVVLVGVGVSGEMVVDETGELIESKGSLSSTELSQLLGISVLLAKERLLVTERFGKACRDDSISGLRFYPNLFLTKDI